MLKKHNAYKHNLFCTQFLKVWSLDNSQKGPALQHSLLLIEVSGKIISKNEHVCENTELTAADKNVFTGSKLKPKIFFFSASKEVKTTQKTFIFTKVRSLTSIAGHALILFSIGIHNTLCCSIISATCLPQRQLSATACWQDSNIKRKQYKGI